MGISDHLKVLVTNLSKEGYDQTLSDYRFWTKIGVTHGWTADSQLHDDISANIIRPCILHPYTSHLIHPTSHLLLQFITDVELDPISPTHVQLCRSSLKDFFAYNSSYAFQAAPQNVDLCNFYSQVNILAHCINLGCLDVEDVRDHILQSLTLRPDLQIHQLHSLLILLKISGATFAAHVDPFVMDRCLNVLKTSTNHIPAAATLVKDVINLSESGWEGLPPPPIFRTAKLEKTISKSQDPAATPVAMSLGLPNVGELLQTPTHPSPTACQHSNESTRPSSPPSPSTSISAFSDFTVADSLDDEPIAEPKTVTPHDTFYLDDGSAEVTCGMTLFRVHTSALSFHSPVLRQMFSPANLATAESPNAGCPRIVSSDTPTEFEILLKAIYLPGFPEKNQVPDFSTFSSLLKVSTKYEMPNLRAQILENICHAYPENFEGLEPSKTLGENVFSGSKPHPNAVLNLFVQQKVTSALPMAYYMAARRGLDSLMDSRFQSGATLSGQTLKFAMRGLMTLREMELKEMHRIIFTFKGTANWTTCSTKHCPSRSSKGLSDVGIMQAHQRVFDRITGSVAGGTRILQVLSANEVAGDGDLEFCLICREMMEVAHADVRRKAWIALPGMFGLKV